jgi:putative spermidine/putrescine transport system permease protein
MKIFARRTMGRSPALLFVAVVFLLFVLPLFVLLLYTFAGPWKYPDILPADFSLRAFRFAAGRFPAILVSLASSTLYSLTVVFISILLTILPARTFAWYPLRFKGFLEALFLSPALLPVMTFSMGAHVLLLRLRLADTWFGIVAILTVFAYPYMLRTLVQGYQRISPDYSVTARNLGAGYWRGLWAVELPMLLPALEAGASVVFLVAFSEYFLVFLVGGGAVPSYTGYLVPFLKGSDLAIGSLLTLLFLIVPVGLFLLLDGWTRSIYGRRGLNYGTDTP